MDICGEDDFDMFGVGEVCVSEDFVFEGMGEVCLGVGDIYGEECGF